VGVYDLIGAVCRKSQCFKNSGLFRISFGEDRAGTWGLFFGSGVERDDLADIGEAFDHSGDAQMDPRLLKLTAQQAQDHQSQDAIEGMNSELLVRPVVSGPEGEDMGVLHASEGCFDMGLAAIGTDNLFVAPVVTVREEKGFTEKSAPKVLPCLIIKAP